MEATLFLTIVAGLFFGGVFVGYKYRDIVGAEVTKFAADLKTEYAKAKTEVEAGVGDLKKAYEAAKADAEKATEDLKSAATSAKNKLEEIKKL